MVVVGGVAAIGVGPPAGQGGAELGERRGQDQTGVPCVPRASPASRNAGHGVEQRQTLSYVAGQRMHLEPDPPTCGSRPGRWCRRLRPARGCAVCQRFCRPDIDSVLVELPKTADLVGLVAGQENVQFQPRAAQQPSDVVGQSGSAGDGDRRHRGRRSHTRRSTTYRRLHRLRHPATCLPLRHGNHAIWKTARSGTTTVKPTT